MEGYSVHTVINQLGLKHATIGGKDEMETEQILVGSKPPIDYCSAIIYKFIELNAEKVVVKAYGRNISNAVISTNMAIRKLEEIYKIKTEITNIEIYDDPIRKGERTSYVSGIEITIEKIGEI